MRTKLIRRMLNDIKPLTTEDEARPDPLFARPDSEIDLSDIPEWTA